MPVLWSAAACRRFRVVQTKGGSKLPHSRPGMLDSREAERTARQMLAARGHAPLSSWHPSSPHELTVHVVGMLGRGQVAASLGAGEVAGTQVGQRRDAARVDRV